MLVESLTGGFAVFQTGLSMPSRELAETPARERRANQVPAPRAAVPSVAQRVSTSTGLASPVLSPAVTKTR